VKTVNLGWEWQNHLRRIREGVALIPLERANHNRWKATVDLGWRWQAHLARIRRGVVQKGARPLALVPKKTLGQRLVELVTTADTPLVRETASVIDSAFGIGDDVVAMTAKRAIIGGRKVAVQTEQIVRATASGSCKLAITTAKMPVHFGVYVWQVYTGQRAFVEDAQQSQARAIVHETFDAETEVGTAPPAPLDEGFATGGTQEMDEDEAAPIERVMVTSRMDRPRHRLYRRSRIARMHGGNIAQLVRCAKAKWSNLHAKDTPAMRSVVSAYIRKTAFKNIPNKDLRTTFLANSLSLAVEMAFLPNEAEVVASRIPTTNAARLRKAALGERTLWDVVYAAVGIVNDVRAKSVSH
jgi:hypothetical protein